MEPLELPRTLVTRLLQQVQRAGTESGTLPAGADHPPLFWRVHPDPDTPPGKEALTGTPPGGAYLAVCLSTRGVLQMRAWHRNAAGEPEAREVGIREA